MFSQTMIVLQLDEELQKRAHDFYDTLTEAKFIRSEGFFDIFNEYITSQIKLHQVENAIREIGLFDEYSINQVEHFSSMTRI